MIDKPTLSPAKLALLEKRLGRKPSLDSPHKAIARRPDRSIAPISFEQERIVSIARAEGRFSHYSNAFRLKGPLDSVALGWALSEMAKRHEILRTAIQTLDGKLCQVIHPARSLALPLIDITESAEEKREGEAFRVIKTVGSHPFDLAKGPLYRAALLRLGDEDHILAFAILHLIADRQSIGILFSELITLYNAFSNGRPSPLQEMPIQYGDYASWQREEENFKSEILFWKRQLDGCNTRLDLHASYARPQTVTYRGKFRFLHVSERLTESLRAFSRQEGVTLFMTMFAAFNILLRGYMGQDDILVSVPIAKRNRTELEGLIGCFTNTLVMRTRLAGNQTFRDLLYQVRDCCVGAFSHQSLPFEKLLEHLRPAQEPGYLPLVQIGFGLQSSKASNLVMPSLEIHPLVIGTDRALLDLMMRVEESAEQLEVSLQYKTDLFSEEMADGMLGHYKNLLESILSNPNEQVSELASTVKSPTASTLD